MAEVRLDELHLEYRNPVLGVVGDFVSLTDVLNATDPESLQASPVRLMEGEDRHTLQLPDGTDRVTLRYRDGVVTVDVDPFGIVTQPLLSANGRSPERGFDGDPSQVLGGVSKQIGSLLRTLSGNKPAFWE